MSPTRLIVLVASAGCWVGARFWPGVAAAWFASCTATEPMPAGSGGGGVTHHAPDETFTGSVACVDQLVAKAERLLKEGDPTAARGACKAALDAAALDKATAGWLAAADGALWRLGLAAQAAGDLRTAHVAWQAAHRHREAVLPDDHPDLQRARENLAMTTNAIGDLRAALALQEKALAVYVASLPDDSPDVQRARGNLAATLISLGDLAGALALQEKVLAVFARTLPDHHPEMQRARGNLALTKYTLGDLPEALALQESALAVLVASLPDHHPDLQRARSNLATTKSALGDLPGALALQEKVFAVRSTTLPDDHPYLQRARLNLAVSKFTLGDLPGALALQEKALAVFSTTLPDDHPDLQRARGNLAATKSALGDPAGALALHEKVFAVRAATLPETHPDLQIARMNLAVAKAALGDLPEALALHQQAVGVLSTVLPEDHPDLQMARGNLATAKSALGDLLGAQALQEQVLAVLSRTLPADHHALLEARGNLANTKSSLGDLPGALALQEQVLAAFSATLPDAHPDLQAARQNLAVTKYTLGDLPGALALFEKVLAVTSGTLPDAHRDLQAARLNVANTRRALGDLSGALVVEEKVMATFSTTLPDDHFDLQIARANLALTKRALGDLDGALTLQQKVVAVFSRTLPHGHSDLQLARSNLAATMANLGDLPGALAQLEGALAVLSATLPHDHPDLQSARTNLAETKTALGDVQGAAQLQRSSVAGALTRLVSHSVSLRDVTELARQASLPLSHVNSLLDVGRGLPGATTTALRNDALQLLEATRSAELHTARLRQTVREEHPDDFARLATQLAQAARRLDDAVALRTADGRTSSDAHVTRDDAIREAALARDTLERQLSALIPETMRVAPDPARLAARLAPRETAASFLTYTRWTNDRDKPWLTSSEQRYGAFVLTPSGEVSWHSLAPVADVDALIAGIRSDVLAGQQLALRSPVALEELVPGRDAEANATKGPTLSARLTDLRRLLFDPILAALPAGTDSLVLSLADELQLVPLDELPLPSGKSLGEAFAVRTVWSLRVLMQERVERTKEPTAVVLGGADYDTRPDDSAPYVPGAATPIVEPLADAGPERSDSGSHPFAALPGTKTEAEALAATFASAFAGRSAVALLGAYASEAAFVEEAPGGTFLHLATHGYFAPEDAWRATDAKDADPLARFDVRHTDRTAQLSPYSLAGIALTGANLPADELGRREGILSAQEIIQLDLQQCYLATLSACKTSLGVRRAGTGLASLRQAFHAAGARFVLATLWEVNDARAGEIIADFYTRLWQHGQDPHPALRGAKLAAKERGAPFRDWAGWVLSGR